MKVAFSAAGDQISVEIGQARALVDASMRASGFSDVDAAVITDQIIECELRGVSNAGLSRAITLCEAVASSPPHAPIRITRETPVSALVEGGGWLGYLVAKRAVDLGVQKALSSGVAVIAARDTAYTGMFAHYLEIATRAGLVAFAAGNAGPHVAPHGAVEARLGTNPLAFGFPASGDPIIFDAGTSAVVLSELALAERLGLTVPEGLAYDAYGEPTVDPAAALQGAIKSWGGHRGSGLATAVHLLGMLAGGDMVPGDTRGSGFLFIAIRPDLFGDADAFASAAAQFGDYLRSARAAPGHDPVRIPFERSAQRRREAAAGGRLQVSARVVETLSEIANGEAPS